MRSLSRLAMACVLLLGVLVVAFSPTTATAVAADDRLAISVIGDGVTSGNNGVPVALRIINGDGEQLDTINFPIAASDDQHPFTLGANAAQAGALQQSADHQFVTIGGYSREPASGSLNGSGAPDILRVAGIVDADGNVDTSTTFAGAFNVRHIRGVVTSNGTQIWAGGHGHDSSGPVQAGVLAISKGGDTPTAVVSGDVQLNNGRVVGIHDGELYVTSDRDDYDGLNQVGEGLPTSAASQTLIAEAPAGHEIAHDFVFAGDYLYVGFTEGAQNGIAKYAHVDGSWTHIGSHTGEFWGLTGRVAGDDIVLYAVKGSGQNNTAVRILDTGGDDDFVGDEVQIAAAGSGYAFRGIAFAPGFEPGTDPVTPGIPVPNITWDVRVAGGAGNALGAVHGADSNPVATGTITDPEGEDFTVTAISSDSAVVKDDDIELTVQDDGSFILAALSSAPGKATITVRVETDDERLAETSLNYWVSEPLSDPRALAHHGMSDASAAYDAGDGYRFVADDDSNQIRLFGPDFGEAVAEFDFSGDVTPIQAGQTWDLEGAARIDDTIYWVGSLGNTRSGNIRLDRDIVLATTISGSGADAELTFAGYTRGVRQVLVDWDHGNEHGLGEDYYGFFDATQDGVSAEGPEALNVEGAAIAPDGTTLWLGFRSPIVPLGVGDNALIVGVENIAEVVAGADPQITAPIELDLDGRAIRDVKRTEDGNYLIIAGSADDTGNFAIFGWSGDPADAPLIADTLPHIDGWDGSYEASGDVPSLADGTEIWLIKDSGTFDIYNDGTEAQDLFAAEVRKFISHPYTLSFSEEFGVVPVPTLELNLDEVVAGEDVEVTASGFEPGATIDFELHSDPVHLATAIADAEGSLTATLTIPAETAPGEHTLVAISGDLEATAAITILAATDASGSAAGAGLPATGAWMSFWLLIAALLALATGVSSFRFGQVRSGA